MVGSWTSNAKNQILAFLFSTHQAMLDSSSFVDAFKTVPVAVRDVVQAWLEAIGVIAFVTPITKEQRIFIVTAVAELTKGFHD